MNAKAQKSKAQKYIYIAYIPVFLSLAVVCWHILIFKEPSVFLNILGSFFVYFFLYTAVASLIEVVKFPYSEPVLNVLGFPIYAVFKFNYFFTPIFTVCIFLGVFLIPTSIILILNETSVAFKDYSNGLLYLVNVFAIIMFAYFGKPIMKYVIDINKLVLGKEFVEKFTSVLFTRVFTYFIMIIIYLAYNYFVFSGVNAFENTIVENQLAIIKEVLVSFVAIDTLIQIIIKWREDNKNKELENEIKN